MTFCFVLYIRTRDNFCTNYRNLKRNRNTSTRERIKKKVAIKMKPFSSFGKQNSSVSISWVRSKKREREREREKGKKRNDEEDGDTQVSVGIHSSTKLRYAMEWRLVPIHVTRSLSDWNVLRNRFPLSVGIRRALYTFLRADRRRISRLCRGCEWSTTIGSVASR